jgi:hypothetical protein
MDKLAFVGFVLMLAVIPLMQYSLDNYKQYLEQQREEDQRAIACANMICFGRVLFPQLYFDLSMQYLLAGLTAGSDGAVFVGLNWRKLTQDHSLE